MNKIIFDTEIIVRPTNWNAVLGFTKKVLKIIPYVYYELFLKMINVRSS